MGGFTPYLSHNQIYGMVPLELNDYNISHNNFIEQSKKARIKAEEESKRKGKK